MTFTYERIQKLIAVLKEQTILEETPLTGILYKPCGYKKGNALPPVDRSWTSYQEGERWGGQKDSHCWFYRKVHVENPDCQLCVRTGLEGEWDATNPQFIAYVDAELAQGLDVNHTTLPLEPGDHEIYLYAYSGMTDKRLDLFCSLQRLHRDTQTLYYHLKVLHDICGYLNPNEKNYVDLLGHMERAVNLVDFRVFHSPLYCISVQKAVDYLEKEVYKKGSSEITTVCIGHTHIDVAWLWTLAQTREKVQRSFATAVSLMKRYPEYKFMSSQAVLYQYLKEECPPLYEQIKQLVKEKRWEAEGAMWVEADCNLSSGESLIRQILYGKRFFREEFGVENDILWLPDAFGYSAAMPQILKKCGITKFVTSKISWNETNQMPYDTFLWQGIDGTKILSYFLTAQDKQRGADPVRYTTYVGNITPAQVAGTWDRYQNKDLNNETLLTFGYGDGGGGPTDEMLEVARRLKHGVPGCPAVRVDFAGNFLNRLEEKAANCRTLPVWVGELYLELHRGTYTTMGKNKRNNRKSEYLYQQVEFWSLFASRLGLPYPEKELRSGWELILLNQFHDILPGSSIGEVYEESDRQYAQVFKKGDRLLEAAQRSIAQKIQTDGGLMVFNPHSFPYSGPVECGGTYYPVDNIPPKGYRVVPIAPVESKVSVTENSMENPFLRIELENGNIIRIFDKRRSRELLKAGQRANILQACEDIPRDWDAWEICDYYDEKIWELTDTHQVEILHEGARAGLRITKTFLSSTIIQRIYLYDCSPRIDFETTVDWQQQHILLKALFPMDIHAEKATYDIQFGTVERPTHKNTSWDAARFEVCAHKFADISEDDYGVSLMNDCKYGYDITDGNMRLTLLKSPTYPNPTADRGRHEFTYSLYPHEGNYTEGGTFSSAFALNIPPQAMVLPAQSGPLGDCFSFVSCDKDNIIIETIKKAEDSDAMILRLYDAYNRRCQATLTFGFDPGQVFLTDMLERCVQPLPVHGRSVTLPVGPFEIITLAVTL